jgi:hypothetical protein
LSAAQEMKYPAEAGFFGPTIALGWTLTNRPFAQLMTEKRRSLDKHSLAIGLAGIFERV